MKPLSDSHSGEIIRLGSHQLCSYNRLFTTKPIKIRARVRPENSQIYNRRRLTRPFKLHYKGLQNMNGSPDSHHQTMEPGSPLHSSQHHSSPPADPQPVDYTDRQMARLGQLFRVYAQQQSTKIAQAKQYLRHVGDAQDRMVQDSDWVYLVSLAWLEKWKKSVHYEYISKGADIPWQLSSNRAALPAINQDLVSVGEYFQFQQLELQHLNTQTRENIKQGMDFTFCSQQMWAVLKQHPGYEIRRQVIDDAGFKIVEVGLQKIKLVVLTHHMLKQTKDKGKLSLLNLNVQYSRHGTLGKLADDIREGLMEYLKDHGARMIDDQYTQMHLWIVNPEFSQADLERRIRLSVSQQDIRSKNYTIRLQAKEGDRLQSLSQQIPSQQALVVCQLGTSTSHRICYNHQSPAISECPCCLALQSLPFFCKCKYMAYCSQKCQDEDAAHFKRCPHRKKLLEAEAKRLASMNGLVGLVNLGNTCYMNSGIQCLSNVKELTEYFISGQYIKDLRTDNPLGSRAEVTAAYAELMKSMWLGTLTKCSPHELKKAISRHHSMFAGYEQHDSGELISYLLDDIHEDLNKIKVKPYFPSKEEDDRPDEIIANEQWSQFLLRNNSKIVELMYGQYRSQVDCPKCNFRSVQFDPFLMCQLPIPPESHNTTSVSPQQSKVQFYLVNDDLTQELLVIGFTGLPQLYQLIDQVRALKQLPRTVRLIAYCSKTVLEQTSLITQIKLRYKNSRICIAKAPQMQPEQEITCCVEYMSLSSSGASRIFCNSLYKFPADATLAQVHQQLYSAVKEDLFEGKDYAEILAIPATTRPALIRVPELGIGGVCWFCGFRCTGCEFMCCHRKLREYRKKLISLKFIIKVEKLPEKYTTAAVLTNETKTKTIRQGPPNLKDCFKAFEKLEILSAENAWLCFRCKEHVAARRQISVYRSPDIFVICLKRFKKSYYRMEKSHSLVEFPVTGLDLSSIVAKCETGSLVYDLVGVSYHLGEAGGGHYIAKCKNFVNGRWYRFDDCSVTLAEETSISNRDAYILVYRRRK